MKADSTSSAAVVAPTAPVPASDRVAWACLAVAASGLGCGLVQYWRINPEHIDRLLVLAASAWAAYSLRDAVAAAPVRPRPWLGLPLLLVGAAALPAAAYLHARVGGRTLLLWWQAAGVVTAASGLIVARAGWPRLRVFAFPLLFPFFALPLPTKVEAPLQQELKGATTSLATASLRAVGLPVVRSGFVLHLESGDLGMADACSGIRSLPALSAIAAFLSFLRGFGPARTAALLVSVVPVVLGVNAARVVLTGMVQTWIGPEYAEGGWHEALGVVMVLVGLGILLTITRLLGSPASPPESPPPVAAPGEPARSVGWAAAGILLAATVCGLAAAAAGWTALSAAAAAAPLDSLPMALAGWRGKEQPIPPGVSDMLVYDRAIYRAYTDNLGQEAHVWVVYWTAASAQKGNHSPEACWPARGYTITRRWEQPLPLPNGPAIPSTGWEFTGANGKEGQYVIHWVQDGREYQAWDAEGPASGFGWVQDLFSGSDDGPAPRLMVLIGVRSGTTVARTEVAKFGGLVAGELYAICPWADPRFSRQSSLRE